MEAIVRTPKVPFWHTLKNGIRGKLKPMDVQIERAVVSGRAFGSVQTDADMLKHLLLELDGIIDGATQKPVQVVLDKDGLVSDETLNWLSPEERSEFADVARRRASFTETDRKNSLPPSQPTSESPTEATQE